MEDQAILVVEDNRPLCRFIAKTLTSVGYQVRKAGSGEEAYGALRKELFDLVLLDLNLGDMDGIGILKTIRRQDTWLPVIIVSSCTETGTKVDGFEIGCDDYITKPFYAEELLGRVRRLLKRTGATPQTRVPITDVLDSGPFSFELTAMRVYKNGRQLTMRKKLFDLFLFFASNPNVVLSKETLFAQAWDYRDDLNENSLYVHIRQLRMIIEDDPSHPKHLVTVRGAGFSYSPVPTES